MLSLYICFTELYFFYSRISDDVTKIHTKILSILLSFWVSWGITAPEHLYLNKLLVRNGSSFCDGRRLNFYAFAWRGMWVKNITNFGRICNLNFPWFKNKFHFNPLWVFQAMNWCISRKTQNRCFCWFPAAIFVPLKRTQTWRLYTKLYKFA